MSPMQHFAQQMAAGSRQDLSIEQQREAGKPVKGVVDDEHKNFFLSLLALIERGEINVDDPRTFLKMDIYAAMPEEWQDRADLILTNLATQIQQIKKFHDDPSFPDDSPQLETMVEQVWQQKQSIEQHYDVFKF